MLKGHVCLSPIVVTDALVLLEDRGQFATLKLYPSGEHLPPSQGESPLPLDRYLSWMSRICPHLSSEALVGEPNFPTLSRAFVLSNKITGTVCAISVVDSFV
jgi:hypothetical protein